MAVRNVRTIKMEGRLIVFPKLIQQIISRYDLSTLGAKTKSNTKAEAIIMDIWQDAIKNGRITKDQPDLSIYVPEKGQWIDYKVPENETVELDCGKWGKYNYDPETLVINEYEQAMIEEMKIKLCISFLTKYSSAKLKVGRKL